MTVVSLRDVTVDFGQNRALDRVTESFDAGTSTAIMGPNGSGKTTLLNVVAQLQAPSSGAVELQPDANVALLSQHASYATWMPLTVADVVTMGCYRRTGLIRRISASDRSLMDTVAERLDIGPMLKRRYGTLSGGQRQRVRIAQALVQEPNVLIMDEPITGLDLPSQEVILALIESEAAAGTTVLITTHHLDEARHCEAVVLLNSSVIATGKPGDILTATNLRSTFGERVLGDHLDHDHDDELLVFDDHAHHHDA